MINESIAGAGRHPFFSMRGRDRLRWYLVQAIGRGGGHHGRGHGGPGRGRGGFMGEAPFGDGGGEGPGGGLGAAAAAVAAGCSAAGNSAPRTSSW